MAILKKIYPIFLTPLLFSCEEVFTPDVPHIPVVCVNSLISAGSPIEVAVSKSRLYTDSPDKSKVSDAEVRVYVNGCLKPASYIPEEGDNVRIVAVCPSVGKGVADVMVPLQIPTPTSAWEAFDVSCWKSGNEINLRFKLRVNLEIQDPEGENFYKFGFNSWWKPGENPGGLSASGNYGFSVGSFQYDMEPIFSEHIGIFESIMGGDAEGFTFFSDRQFSGRSYTLHLQFDYCWFRYPAGEVPECTLNLIINSVSQSYYNWSNYVWQRDNGTLSGFGDYGFGDPLWGYSNVSSGAGVVAAQSESVCTVDLTGFIRKTIDETIK